MQSQQHVRPDIPLFRSGRFFWWKHYEAELAEEGILEPNHLLLSYWVQVSVTPEWRILLGNRERRGVGVDVFFCLVGLANDQLQIRPTPDLSVQQHVGRQLNLRQPNITTYFRKLRALEILQDDGTDRYKRHRYSLILPSSVLRSDKGVHTMR